MAWHNLIHIITQHGVDWGKMLCITTSLGSTEVVMHHCERKIGSSPSKRRAADLPLSGVGLLPPGAVPGMFATISSLKTTSLSCVGLLPPGAVPGGFAKMSEGMGLLPPGAVPGGFAKTSKGMGLLPPGAVPGGFAKTSKGMGL
jgi:hypothetical protein